MENAGRKVNSWLESKRNITRSYKTSDFEELFFANDDTEGAISIMIRTTTQVEDTDTEMSDVDDLHQRSNHRSLDAGQSEIHAEELDIDEYDLQVILRSLRSVSESFEEGPEDDSETVEADDDWTVVGHNKVCAQSIPRIPVEDESIGEAVRLAVNDDEVSRMMSDDASTTVDLVEIAHMRTGAALQRSFSTKSEWHVGSLPDAEEGRDGSTSRLQSLSLSELIEDSVDLSHEHSSADGTRDHVDEEGFDDDDPTHAPTSQSDTVAMIQAPALQHDPSNAQSLAQPPTQPTRRTRGNLAREVRNLAEFNPEPRKASGIFDKNHRITFLWKGTRFLINSETIPEDIENWDDLRDGNKPLSEARKRQIRRRIESQAVIELE